MRTIPRPAPALLLAAVLAACGSDSTAPAATDQVFTATNVAVTNSVDLEGRCAPDRTLNIQGTGASNLGTITVVQSHCFNPASANPLAFHDGRFTNTLADGATFSGTYQGASVPMGSVTTFGIQGQWEITGGTGSYAGATGSGTATGQANVQTGEGSITLNGTIRRP